MSQSAGTPSTVIPEALATRTGIHWLIAARIAALAVLLMAVSVSAVVFPSEISAQVSRLYRPIAVVFAFYAASALWIRMRPSGSLFMYSQLLADGAIITAIIFLSGGALSPFLFLYIPHVMAASLLVKRRLAFALAAFDLMLYVAPIVLIKAGLAWQNTQLAADLLPLPSTVLQLCGLTSAMVVIVLSAGLLSRRLNFSAALIEQSRRDLAKMTSREKEFLKDIDKLKLLEDQIAVQERMARLMADERVPQASTMSELPQFVGESAVMQKIFSLIKRVAPSDATVLIDGESGTGKELVAKAIHLSGPRSSAPFVPVNCGAIPENLLESEFFGHKRGSFTGAESDHAGLFRQAHSGTLFLDEIGELPLHMQSKLLRALQEKSVRPVGGDRDVPIDVRIIAATNKNLRREVELQRFREDLFYRLNVLSIMLPPLRERKEDVPLLANAILRRLCKERQMPVISPAAMQLLLAYPYPGNVRELENILERTMVLGGDVILPEHFPESLQTPAAGVLETRIIIDENIQFPVKLEEILAKIERVYLEGALGQTGGAKKKAAALLGINFRSFRYRLQKFGIGGDDASDQE